MWKRLSTSESTPNGFLYCAGYLNGQSPQHRCPKGYKDCNPAARQPAALASAAVPSASAMLQKLESESAAMKANGAPKDKDKADLASRLAMILEEAKMIEGKGGGS